MTERPEGPPPPVNNDYSGWGHEKNPMVDPALAREYARLSPRAQYRIARSRRQTIIFGSALLGMVASLVVGGMGVLGMLPDVFGNDFSRRIAYAEPGDTPCPTEGARPGSSENVRLIILNTTSTPGLAGQVGSQLETLGYTVTRTDNAPPFRGTVEIEAGPRGVDAAYTLARYLGSDVRITLNTAEDMTLTVLLGQSFDGVLEGEEIEQISTSNFALIPLDGCLPVAEPKGGWELPEQYQQSGQSGQSGETE